MSRLRFRFSLVAALLAAACSSSTSFVGDGGGSPNGTGVDDSESAEGKGEGGTSSDAGAVDVPPAIPTKIGRIYAGQTITIVGGNEYYSSYATAMFYESPPAGGGPSGCTYAKHESCHVCDCPHASAPSDAGAPRYAGAGTVSLTGGFTTYSLDIDPGSYQTVSSQQLLYESGTVLRVSSTGAEVPAFSNESITVPSTSFDVTSPNLDTQPALSRNQALAIAWTNAGNRDVQVSLSTTQKNVRSVSIQCTFPGAGGSATVPAAAMQKLLATSASTEGFLSIGAPVETTFQAGEWHITFGLTPYPHTNEFTTSN